MMLNPISLHKAGLGWHRHLCSILWGIRGSWCCSPVTCFPSSWCEGLRRFVRSLHLSRLLRCRVFCAAVRAHGDMAAMQLFRFKYKNIKHFSEPLSQEVGGFQVSRADQVNRGGVRLSDSEPRGHAA